MLWPALLAAWLIFEQFSCKFENIGGGTTPPGPHRHIPAAQKHGIYPKPWNHEFKHSRCGALGVWNECHGKQKSQIKMSSGKLAIIKGC